MSRPPLEGYRVVNLGTVWAAPVLGQLLADFGAEVVKVESMRRLDAGRLYPTITGEKDIDLGYTFLNWNHSTLSMTADFSKPQGADLVKTLVAKSDVVIENFPPRVLPSYGLDYAHLRAVKPDIIMISMPAAGQYGPLRDIITYGPTLSGLAGMTSLLGYPDPQGAQVCAETGYADPMAAAAGTFYVLAALRYRDLTGEGQLIDMAQWETLTSLLGGEPLMDYVMNQRVMGFQANHSPWMAPHNTYRCQGDDKWVSIAVKTDEEWQSFCRAIGNPPWTKDERFADLASRLRHQEELDRHISQWTIHYTHYEVMDILQRAGVAAAPALDQAGRLADPHITSRETYTRVDHPKVKGIVIYNLPWKLSRTPGQVRPAPTFGQHNDYVYKELLGFSADEMARLIREKTIY